MSTLKSFQERLIRVSLNPSEPPLDRVYGFWLRTLEPPGHVDCRPRIFSRSNQSDIDFVCLREKEWGTAGVVFMEPKSKSGAKYAPNQSGWSKIRWIKLGFDDDFNPMILLGNEIESVRAQQLKPTKVSLDRAITSGVGSRAYNALFDNRWVYSLGSVPSRYHGWYTGIAILKVDRKKGLFGCLESLNLGISVKLVDAPDIHPDMMADGTTNRDLRQIWAVDITDTKGSDPEQDLAKSEKDASREECWASLAACCF